jgi:hypothetical protein
MKKLVVLSLALVCAVIGRAQAQVPLEDFNRLKDRVDVLEKSVKAQSDELAAARKLLNQAADQLNTLSSRVADNDLKLRDLYRQDPANPNRAMVDLLGNMERSPAFRADVDKITTGRLVIDNPTGIEQYLYVNGTLWRVIPGRSFAPVGKGAVTVQRPGAEAEVLADWQFDPARGSYVTYRYPAVYSSSVVTFSPVVVYP